MYQQIAQSLFQKKSCLLPGLGTLSIVYESAQTDFVNSQILSPGYKIVFDQTNVNAEGQDGFSAVIDSIKNDLEHKKSAELIGIGSFSVDEKGKIHFSQIPIDENFLQPVFAERVIHENATHNMLVGDKETTTTVMTDFFNEKPLSVERWWMIAAALLVVTASVLCYHFYENGGSLTNRNTIELTAPDSSYKEVR